ncbi:MAG: homocysteine S-methyltransferase family protein [Polyangiales bacterium]
MTKASDPLVILDGPLGTELAARGIETGLPLWSAAALDTAPDVVAAIHRDYAAAGATVHTTDTFRTQPRWMGEAFEAKARLAVALCRGAVPAGHRVAGSIAPVEDCYRPDRSPGEGARAEHRALARVLVDAGVDLLLCETFPHPEEALVAVEEAVATGKPTWLALTAGPDADLMNAESMRATAREAVARGASAVLVNCVPASRTAAFVEALAGLGVPFGAYANAGRADERIGWVASAEPGATAYAELARGWIALGASLVGSCCGTGPAHVRALAELARALGRS